MLLVAKGRRTSENSRTGRLGLNLTGWNCRVRWYTLNTGGPKGQLIPIKILIALLCFHTCPIEHPPSPSDSQYISSENEIRLGPVTYMLNNFSCCIFQLSNAAYFPLKCG